MPIRNLDDRRIEMRQRFADAMNSEDQEQLVDAFMDMAEEIQNEVLADAANYRQTQDQSILAARGVRVLTNEENEYYNAVITAMQSADARMAITNLDRDLPETIIRSVLNDVITEFPILGVIDMQNTAAVTKWIYNTQAAQYAAWGALGSAITEELSGSVDLIEITHNKLTAFFCISQDMLAEGPTWVDAYIRGILMEAIGLGLSKAVIDGDGKDQPIGMTRDLAKAVQNGKYQAKTVGTLTRLDVKTFGAIGAELSKDQNGRPRAVPSIMIAVNPTDYFQHIMPASTYLTTVGSYVKDVFPYPTQVVQDVNVPTGKAIFGLGKQYFLGVGTGGKGGKIEYSDEFKFLDDERTYKIKMYGNGRPKDNKSFLVYDITGLKGLQEADEAAAAGGEGGEGGEG